MRRIFYLVVIGLLCAVGHDGYAQLNRKAIKKNNRMIGHYRGKKQHFGKEKIYNAVGFSLNAFNYYGDLSPLPTKFSTDINYTRPAVGVSFSHRFGPRYTLTGSFMAGTLSGSDAQSADKTDTNDALFRYKRNLSFRNRVKEVSIVASLDLFENMATYISRVKWTPYAYLGLTVLHHNPKAQEAATFVDGTPNPNAGEWVALKPLGTEGQNAKLGPDDVNYGIKPYKLIQPAIPFGLGVRFRVNEVIDIAGELGFRYLFTDYIDDVSKNYVDLGNFGTNELAKAMSYRSNELTEFAGSQIPEVSKVDGKTYNLIPGYGKEYPDNIRGNNGDRDVYMVTTVRVTYIIGKTFHRAKFR
jgi:hypothetical protein